MTAILLPLSLRDGEIRALVFLQHVFRQPGAERVHAPRGVRAAAQPPAGGSDSGWRAGRGLGELTPGASRRLDSTAENAGPRARSATPPAPQLGAATAQPQYKPARRLAGPLPANSGKMVAGAARRPSPSGSLSVGGTRWLLWIPGVCGKCPLSGAF